MNRPGKRCIPIDQQTKNAASSGIKSDLGTTAKTQVESRFLTAQNWAAPEASSHVSFLS